MTTTRPTETAGVAVPDSALAREATELVRDESSDTVFHHSRRVFFWGSLRGRARGLSADPELLYVGALFHDLGLTERYRRADQRFEIDGADEARRFLVRHGVAEARADLAWQGIALHTTPEIPWHMAPEVALVTAGVEADVLGLGLKEIGDQALAEVVALHPRPDFKRRILQEFTDGIAHRPQTTFGNVKADVLERYVPGYRRENFVDIILGSDWPE
ncbi:HD domain-containing protein [Streptomyces sp. PSKA30]|uniref:HD domain-containing protein n=1 Tax=Streptomyces sp. PSKA30 TaxID=2874597 RepID=UPI001CD12008|nr:HD domain-containing protein [Streptomyces sp. PSKA30]MBZ9644244.1 HD domain-containing protein [Streptomyces sp. PSKA30]